MPIILSTFDFELPTGYLWGYLVAAVVLAVLLIITHIERHASSVEECFIISVMLGIASYWLPTVVFLTVPVYGYLVYRNVFSVRAFLASFIGLGLVAVWMAVLSRLEILDYPFQIAHNPYAWIPTGSLLFAYIASTIARRILRVR